MVFFSRDPLVGQDMPYSRVYWGQPLLKKKKSIIVNKMSLLEDLGIRFLH
jgi:hypothetical protein